MGGMPSLADLILVILRSNTICFTVMIGVRSSPVQRFQKAYSNIGNTKNQRVRISRASARLSRSRLCLKKSRKCGRIMNGRVNSWRAVGVRLIGIQVGSTRQ